MGFDFIEITVIAKTIHLLTHLSISSLFQFTNEHFMTHFLALFFSIKNYWKIEKSWKLIKTSSPNESINQTAFLNSFFSIFVLIIFSLFVFASNKF